MGRFSTSFKEAIHNKFSKSQTSPASVDPVENDRLIMLRGEIDHIGKILTDKIDELTVVARESEQLVNNRIKHSEEVVESLWQQVTMLEAKVKEAESVASQKEAAVHKTEETLGIEIRQLENELKNKSGELESRANEMHDFKSKNDAYIRQVVELESVIAQNKADAIKQIEHHEHEIQMLKEDIDLLKVRLQGAEEISAEKDLTLQRLQQEHKSRVEEFERQVTTKDDLLAERENEIKELKSNLEFLTCGIKHSSSFFREAEAFAHRSDDKSEPPDGSGQGGQSPITASPAAKNEETVSSEFLDRASEHLTLSLGPMAPIIMRDHIVALGERTERFPKRRVFELVDILSNEIANTDLRFSFRDWFVQQLSTA